MYMTEIKLASFDIFDTTLIRKSGTPENLFYILAKTLFPENEALQKAFFIWRKRAEREVIEKLNNQYLTLEDIYSFGDYSYSSNIPQEYAIALEYELEKKNLIANARIKKKILNLREKGYTICFISDMYLNSTYLKELLIQQDCACKNDRIFVSCEAKATKYNGKLYDIVRNQYQDIRVWEHYGDNEKSDYIRAAEKGIKAHLVHTEYTETEQLLIESSKNHPSNIELNILAGFQRAARFCSELSNANIDNAADFVASLYTPYVMYVLRKSTELHLGRLYFLSRDGYILQQIAEMFSCSFPNIECRYLFVSRYSLFLPSLFTLTKEEIYENLGVSSLHKNRKRVKDIFKYLRITPIDLENSILKDIPFNRIQTQEQEDVFFNLLQQPKVKQLILERASAARKILLDYFKQEGLLDGSKYGIVDVGWVGTSRLMINRLLENTGKEKQVCFYYGCSPDALPSKFGLYYSFCNDNLYTAHLPSLLEQYYSASPYPSTDSYYYEDGVVKIYFKDRKFMQAAGVTEANIMMCRKVSSFIQEFSYIQFEYAMQFWGGMYLNMFLGMQCHINYSTFSRLGAFDDRKVSCIIKRVTPLQLFVYMYKGKIKGIEFPRQSIYYTYGIKVHTESKCLRTQLKRLYKKIVRFIRIGYTNNRG